MANKEFQKDLITFSIVMGSIATLIKTILTIVPYYLNITNNMGILEMGKTIFNISDVPADPGHIIISFLGYIGFGSILAIGLSIIFAKSGTDFYLLKGAIYGLFVWLTLRNAFIPIGMPGKPDRLDLVTAIFSLTSHVIYGLVLAYLVKKYNRFILKAS